MTAFITHCWKNKRPDVDRVLVRLLLGLCLLGQVPFASGAALLEQLRAQRVDKVLMVQARLRLELGPAVEEALRKGVAVHFVATASLVRERWYWTNQKVAQVNRYYRLSYQPLTRQWRVQISSEPLPGGPLGGTLAQSFDALEDALEVIAQQSGWPLVDMASLDTDARHELSYSFRLDVTQLPRPFQFAIGNQSDWNLQLNYTQILNLASGS